ncbi:MAG TPA: carbohydrate porin [Verrucomicrobiae bacterium]|jgi:high affinity Mn2+ porin|nr:carbohydrate porin [Verrucomicrobiae bacterium]
MRNGSLIIASSIVVLCAVKSFAASGGADTNTVIAASSEAQQNWNWHAQNTDIVQGDPSFPANYSGPNSLHNHGEVRESVSVDLMGGARLWRGAEAHLDGLMWQGFGLSRTLGVESFPNGEAFRVGTDVPHVNLARVLIRQTIGLGGDEETVEDDQFQLAGKRDISRVTFTVGRMSAKDIFDNNSYANDPRTQFMSWGLMANEAWDYPADSLGFMTGAAVELNEPGWAARYGFFQVPKVANGTALDSHFLEAWAMVTELERRFSIQGHPGAVRLLGYLNRAHMGNYSAALSAPGVDITQTRAYRYKYGFGLNAEQEIVKDLGVFTRLGWSDGKNEGWMFSDVDYAMSAGLSVKGELWNRANDTFGLAGVFSGISGTHQQFLANGGVGILAGDGALSYGWEKTLETYYDFQIWKTIHATLDYQFISDPAFNRDRGPVNVFAARLHWEF